MVQINAKKRLYAFVFVLFHLLYSDINTLPLSGCNISIINSGMLSKVGRLHEYIDDRLSLIIFTRPIYLIMYL